VENLPLLAAWTGIHRVDLAVPAAGLQEQTAAAVGEVCDRVASVAAVSAAAVGDSAVVDFVVDTSKNLRRQESPQTQQLRRNVYVFFYW
jgi:hypothetical protein